MTALLWKLAGLLVGILMEQCQLTKLVIVKLHTVITSHISQMWWQIFLKTIPYMHLWLSYVMIKWLEKCEPSRKTATFLHQKQSIQTLWSSENYHHLIIALTPKMSVSTVDTGEIKTFPSWSKSVDKPCFISFSYRLCGMFCQKFEKKTCSVTTSSCVFLSFPTVRLTSSQFLSV